MAMTASDLIERFGRASTPQKLAGAGLLTVIFGAVFYFMFYSETADTAERLERKIASAQADKVSYEEKQRRYHSFRAEVNKLLEEQKELLKVLPTDAEIPTFLQSIHAQGELSGLNILTFEQKPEQPQQFYATIPVKMEISGSYFQINKFFYSIGQLKRIVNIRDVKLAAPTPTEAGVVLKAEFVASTFRFIKPTASPPAGGSAPPAGQPPARPKG